MQNTTGSFGCKKSACKTLPAVLLAVTLAACGQSTKTNEIQNPKPLTVPLGLLQLQPADNCDELKNYITESIIKEYASIPKYAHYYYCPAPGGGGDAGPAPPASGAAPDQGGESNASDGSGSEGSAAAATPGDVSDTNNQEQGVHEGDIVKADDAGNVYILTGRYFIVADGFPPQNMSEHTRIDLGARGLNLFLDKVNQRVIILARHDEPYYIMTPAVVDESSTVVYPKPEQDYTAVIFYDVSDPANPVVIDQLQLRGYFREGRNIDNRLHLVSNHYLRPLGLYEDAQFWELYNTFNNAVYQTRCDNPQADLATHPAVVSARNNLVARITAIVSSQDPSAYLPDALRINNAGASEPIAYLACTDIQFPAVNMSLGLQIITSVDSDGANLAAAGIVNNSYITYVSQDHLYLAEPSRSWWWEMDDGRRLSSQTAIYKFAISGNTPQYVATGRVDGYVLNQFSFSEYNGALRVATTQNDVFQVSENQWQLVQSNHLSVLTDDGSGALTIAGEVRDFAPNETIRSARFFGEKGFVVTFRNVDPLFTFDLADPSHPVLIGELTIPGFSTYMHAYDDNHLLTIGPSGGEGGTGTGAGVQLQLIDVSDMTNPRVRHSYLPTMPGGWSWSEAEYDHKAFTFYKPANLLAIPLQISPSYSNDVFSGIAAYEVTLADGFRELGRVDHADLAYEYYCVANSAMLAAPYIEDCRNGWYVQWAAPRRSIVMTDESDVYLYTVSDVGLKASSINDLSSTLGSLVFPPQPYPWWYFDYYPIGVSDPVPVAGGGTGIAQPSPATEPAQ